MASQRLSVLSVIANNSCTWNDILENLLENNSNQSYCVIEEQSDSYIGGCFLVKVFHNQTQYNITEGRFETVPYEQTQILKFDIFISSGSMMLWGNKKISTLFVTALEQASRRTLVIDFMSTDYKSILRRLIPLQNVSFIRMKIIDVIIDHGIIANCSVNLTNQENRIQLIKKYMDSISQITVQLGDDSMSVSMTIYSSGSVVVFKDRADIPGELIDMIAIVVEGGNKNG